MIFNKHSDLEGHHAFLSPSSPHWLNYDSEKLENTYINRMNTERGVRLHALAAELIELGIKLPKKKKTLNMYVNDSIGFKQSTEQVLYYSPNCFGTADSISFRGNTLRIFDLKTGFTPAHMEQLIIYAALFCLEYKYNPTKLRVELRIYQNDEVVVYEPSPEEILEVIEIIKEFNALIESMNLEGN